MDELLSIMLNSERITMSELARCLNMSEALIYARLERYEQLGYVKKIIEYNTGGCSGKCGSCKGCGTKRHNFKPSVYWVKGEKME